MEVTSDGPQTCQVAEQLFARAQEGHDRGQGISPGWLFKGLTIYFHNPSSTINLLRLRLASNLARFGGASIAKTYEKAKGKAVTHVVVDSFPSSSSTEGEEEISTIRAALSTRAASGERIPIVVTVEWIEESWKERTLLDEESTFMFFVSAPFDVWAGVRLGLKS